MATYTVNTNAQQEAVITWIVARVNADRARQNPPLPAFTTNNQYFMDLMVKMFQGWKKQYDDTDRSSLDSIWESLTDAQRQQIKTIAGV